MVVDSVTLAPYPSLSVGSLPSSRRYLDEVRAGRLTKAKQFPEAAALIC